MVPLTSNPPLTSKLLVDTSFNIVLLFPVMVPLTSNPPLISKLFAETSLRTDLPRTVNVFCPVTSTLFAKSVPLTYIFPSALNSNWFWVLALPNTTIGLLPELSGILPAANVFVVKLFPTKNAHDTSVTMLFSPKTITFDELLPIALSLPVVNMYCELDISLWSPNVNV